MAQTDRDILFSNEAFVIGMLQAVSGGGLVAGIAQSQSLTTLSGVHAYLNFLTAMAVALMSAVLAAYWKHQYKLWDVKAQVSAAQGSAEEAQVRSRRANRYLSAMRYVFVVSLVGIFVGIGSIIVAFWFRALCTG